MPNNELQEILSARFEGHTHTTDESVWGAIESQLDAEKSDRAGFWFWIFNGLAATLLIGLMIESTVDTYADLAPSMSQVETGTNQQENQQEIKKEQTPNQSKISDKRSSVLIESSEVEFESSKQESSSGESQSKNLFSQESEAIKTNHKESRTAVFRDLRNQQIKNEPAQTLSNSLPALIRPKVQEGYIADLNTRQLVLFPDQAATPNFHPTLTYENERDFVKKLPIHLGLEVSYLNRTSFGTNWFGDKDSISASANADLEENRHFEFSFFSQFDLSKRFSTSIGIGYSRSKYINETWEAAANNLSSSSILESSQYIFTIPLQVKYAFIQKKRIMVSSGLTFQSEFGQVSSTKPDQQSGVSTSTAWLNINQSDSENTKSRIQQFALEPFVQLSIGISPRFSAFGNLGYRWYFGKKITGSSFPTQLNYFNSDIGIMFRIR